MDLGLSRCSLKGVGMRRGASKDTGPKGGVDLGAVPHQLEEGKSANENANTIYKGVETSPSRRLLKL